MKSYQKLLNTNNFETGDLLLFHHKNKCNNICTCLLSCFTNSKYSHSAIIIKDPSWDTDLKGFYILESSYEQIEDSCDNQIKLDCEIVSLEKVLEEYSGNIYWRHIECIRNVEFYNNLENAYSVVHNSSHNLDIIDWIDTKYKLHIGNTRKKNTFFCSTLAVYIYTEVGLLESDTEWTTVSPEMLGTEHEKDEIKFTNCSIHDEVRIK